MQEVSRYDQNRNSPQHIIVKTTSTENRKEYWRIIRKKNQITYKEKLTKITVDFSTEILKARRSWSEVF
jgi:hypothetical protein